MSNIIAYIVYIRLFYNSVNGILLLCKISQYRIIG